MVIKKNLKKIIFLVNRNPVSRYFYNSKVLKRSKFNITELYQLSKPIGVFSPFTNEVNPSNDWYFHARHFKEYLGLPQNYQFKFIIEHGTYPTEQVSEVELEPNLPSYVTYSNYRVDILKRHRPHAFSIGPFIHYVPNFYSKEKRILEKKRLGRNLLVFPAHSFYYIKPNYNKHWFINKIKKMAKDFDSVRICLYWADIQLGLHKLYQNLGFECITAGHILDPNFLPRLKTIIEASDLTISNDVGTHVGYCVYLNKPHIIFHQSSEVKAARKWKELTDDYWSSRPYQEILKEFSKTQHKITPKQRLLINKYYGGKNDIKSKEEFQKIIDFTEEVYQKNRH